MTRAVMWLLLSVVASAAAVLSFSALRDLALLCGFDRSLAWLLPLVVDCGAAAGCVVWLSSSSSFGEDQLGARTSPREDPGPRRFARALTWLLLASSVVGNALVHGLSAYHLQPAWWVVVAVSAIAPAVLGATVHLAVLVGRPRTSSLQEDVLGPVRPHETNGRDPVDQLLEQGVGRRRLARELDISEYQARRLLASRNGAGS